MSDQIPTRAGPETEPPEPEDDRSSLHIASHEDAVDAAARDVRLDAILSRADQRDRAAERRDRQADRRSPSGRDPARIDRDWAARDRDEAAADRAELVALLHERHGIGRATQAVIDQATGILVARKGCTSEEALKALTTAADLNELTPNELAEVLIADQELS